MQESRDFPISNNEWFLWGLFNKFLPFNRFGDNLSTFAWFLRWHRRWPNPRRLRYQDVMYHLKTSGDLASPIRVMTSDKALMKDFVAQEVGAEYCVPTLAVLQSVDECLAFQFPKRCVIKPTHLSGPVILRKNGEAIDTSVFERWFRDNYYYRSREQNYRTLVPKVIVEEFAFDQDAPMDYKFLCYNGRPGMIQVNRDRFAKHVQNHYDADWNLLPFEVMRAGSTEPDPKPPNLPMMLDLSARLSKKFSFVRIDLYTDGKHAVVGEITHMPWNLRSHFYPLSGEDIASRLLFGA